MVPALLPSPHVTHYRSSLHRHGSPTASTRPNTRAPPSHASVVPESQQGSSRRLTGVYFRVCAIVSALHPSPHITHYSCSPIVMDRHQPLFAKIPALVLRIHMVPLARFLWHQDKICSLLCSGVQGEGFNSFIPHQTLTHTLPTARHHLSLPADSTDTNKCSTPHRCLSTREGGTFTRARARTRTFLPNSVDPYL